MSNQSELPQQQMMGDQVHSRKEIAMKTIDKDVLAGYNAGVEKGRLHTDLGLIEFERTKELLLETLPPAPAVILWAIGCICSTSLRQTSGCLQNWQTNIRVAVCARQKWQMQEASPAEQRRRMRCC